jgi:hypothetical protein
MQKRTTIMLALVLVPAAVVAADQPSKPTQPPPPTPPSAIAPDADRLLHQMTDYLAGLQSFKMHSISVDEVVTTAGQKVQVLADSDIVLARPNRLQSTEVDSAAGLAFWYDGKTMTLYCKASNTYDSVPAPPTLDAMIDNARKEFHMEAPGADLLYANAYPALTEQVKSGQVVGHETVEGVATNHLAFQGDEVDWQIWIKDGPQPFPLRFVITTKTMKEQPQFTVTMTKWEPGAAVSDATFAFKPPAGAKKVNELPTTCGRR